MFTLSGLIFVFISPIVLDFDQKFSFILFDERAMN